MDIEQLKAEIEKLQGEIADVKSGERTAEGAEKLTKLRADLAKASEQLVTAEADAAAIENAFADADGDTPAEGGDGGEGGEGETAPVTPAAPETPVTPAPGEGGDGGDGSGAAGGDGAPVVPVALAASGAAGTISPTAHEAAAAEGPQALVLTASGAAVGAGIAPGGNLDRDGLKSILTAAASAAGVMTGRTRILEMGRFGAMDHDDVLGRHNTEIENTRLIARARAEFAKSAGKGNRPVALTAAGCFCGPDELIRTTGVVGRRGRPFAGMFPTIPISGGFRAMPDLAFNVDTDLRSGVTQWTCTDQGNVDPSDPDTLKPCAELRCFTETTYTPYAVSACITAERFHQWAHPEQIDAWVNLLGIEYDALAETLLIDQIEAESVVHTIGDTGDLMEDHSMVAKMIYALASFAYPLGYQYREGSGVLNGYTLSVPVGMSEALYADEKLRGFPSGINSKEEVVSLIERGSGVRMVERLDESTSRKAAAAATVTAMLAGGAIDDNSTPLLPPTFRLYLIPLEGYVHGEGSIVSADWHVDDTLLRSNRMRYFLENVEILANLSVRVPFIIDLPGVIIGAYTDLVEGPVPV